MSVSTLTSQVTYAGNASTTAAYPVSFPFFDATDLSVVVNTAGVPTTLVLGSGYSVSGGTGATGSITTTSAIPATSTVIITRNTAKTQLTSYTTGDRFPAATHEKALDKLTMMVQEATAIPGTATATGSAPFVLQAASAGAPPAWVPQSSGGIAAGAITNTMLAGGITPAKLSTGGPSWNTSGGFYAALINAGQVATTWISSAFSSLGGFKHFVAGTTYFDGTNYITQQVGSNSVAAIATDINGVSIHTAPNTGATTRTDSAATFIGYEKFRVDQYGNVGIGTSSPIFKLQVNGDTRARSFYSYGDVGTLGPTLTIDNTQNSGGRIWSLCSTGSGNGTGAGNLEIFASSAGGRIATYGNPITNCPTTAKAWVNFNGTGTPAIRSSYNVSSITKNGRGDYTVNFATPMADANYSLVGAAGASSTSLRVVSTNYDVQAPTTTATRIQTAFANANVTDCAYINVAIFGN